MAVRFWQDAVGIAMGLLSIALGTLLHVKARGYRREHEAYKKLICHHCQYDRRGLPAEAKCPECGTAPAP